MEEHHGSSSAYLQLFMDEATLYNRIVLGSLLPMKLWDPLPHFIQSWVRNCIGGTVIYFLSASLWCFYIYYLNRNLYFPTDIYSVPTHTSHLTLSEFQIVGNISVGRSPEPDPRNHWTIHPPPNMDDHGDAYVQLFMDETTFYNRVVLGSFLPMKLWDPLPHFIQTWFRNYIGGTLVYLLSGFLWCFYIYYLKRNVFVPKDAIPSNKAMLLQMYVAMKAMPWYCALPTLSEYMVENGWTRCFSRISDVGWPAYFVYLAIYLVIVEFGIYWMHRELHDIKPLYKYLHATHHIYNKQNTLSPFAGLAFHPLDGILQAVPHVIALFLVPTHFTSHIALLFLEAIWTANIHDCIHAKAWPVMGAGYHTIHHTTYRHNYGHYTIWMDWMFGTLRDPKDDESKVM